MPLSFASALLLAASSTTGVSAEFDGYQRRLDTLTTWERLDIVITNNAEEAQTLSLCPNDASRIFRTHRTVTNTAFALKFDDQSWSFNCAATELDPGQRLTLGLFFRPEVRWRLNRDTEAERFLSVETSLGDFTFQDGFGLHGTRPDRESVRAVDARPEG